MPTLRHIGIAFAVAVGFTTLCVLILIVNNMSKISDSKFWMSSSYYIGPIAGAAFVVSLGHSSYHKCDHLVEPIEAPLAVVAE